MIDYYSLPEADLPMTMRPLRKILKERGWKMEKLCLECENNLVLTRPDGVQVKIASSTPPTTSVYALRLADNKMMSYELFREIGVKQPETRPVKTAEEAMEMVEKYGSIVIKPVDGAHGNGVTVGVKDAEQAEEAIRRAEDNSTIMKMAIAQPQLPPDEREVRAICIGYKFVVAVARIPARVTGDGVHSLGELIEIENSTLRTEAYKSDLAYIDLRAARDYLGERMAEIPPAGAKVRVVASCNIGQGGTVEDCSAELGPEMRETAEKIARAAELPVVGVDFYGDEVIEINACPSLYYPTGDAAATRAVEAYADYLAGL